MSDSEYEEEEILIFADFNNHLLPNEFEDKKAAIKVIGLESLNPLAEVSGSIFKGTYEFTMGTDVFFCADNEAVLADPLFEKTCKQTYKYFGKANKVINFERIYIEPRKSEISENVKEEQKEKSNLEPEITYEEAIQRFPTVEEFKKLRFQ